MDSDWCLHCHRHTRTSLAYCSPQCRFADASTNSGQTDIVFHHIRDTSTYAKREVSEWVTDVVRSSSPEMQRPSSRATPRPTVLPLKATCSRPAVSLLEPRFEHGNAFVPPHVPRARSSLPVAVPRSSRHLASTSSSFSEEEFEECSSLAHASAFSGYTESSVETPPSTRPTHLKSSKKPKLFTLSSSPSPSSSPSQAFPRRSYLIHVPASSFSQSPAHAYQTTAAVISRI